MDVVVEQPGQDGAPGPLQDLFVGARPETRTDLDDQPIPAADVDDPPLELDPPQ
jgi:hypothetical protein